MKIIADKNIPFVKNAFADLGAVYTYSDTSIDTEHVEDADILLVRSVTKVNENLLNGSDVKFVASATIGKDHIDEHYLESKQIGFSSAPGCNANSVAEYVVSSMLFFEEELKGKRIAIIGVGNIGSSVLALVKKLDMKITLYDPFIAFDGEYSSSIGDALKDADFVTLHVPLTTVGDYPTFKMVDNTFMSSMKEGAVLINASRGGTIDESAVVRYAYRLKGVVLDVWPEEPFISEKLLKATTIATPHIAGYSYDGKCKGTYMILKAASEYFRIGSSWSLDAAYESIPGKTIYLDAGSSLKEVIHHVYDVSNDDAALREAWNSAEEFDKAFRTMRKNYPMRLEFNHYLIVSEKETELTRLLKSLGFRIEISALR